MAVLEPGQRLGAYVIDELVGRGGMAEVYRARHAALDRAVAIKVLNPEFAVDPTFPLRFLREARAVAKLSHPHIITVHDFDERGDVAFLVMELAEGGTLRDRARAITTLGAAVEALRPVCAALQYAHEQGVVHRDVKPINVLVAADSRPLLADFGLARLATESLDFTQTESVFGSPSYMAPEQALGAAVDRRADVYALGVMTFEIVTGQVPYRGPTAFAVIEQHVNAALPSVREIIPEAPAALDVVIGRAMAKRPEDRFPTVEAFATALEDAARGAADLPIGTAGRRNAQESVAASLQSPPPHDTLALPDADRTDAPVFAQVAPREAAAGAAFTLVRERSNNGAAWRNGAVSDPGVTTEEHPSATAAGGAGASNWPRPIRPAVRPTAITRPLAAGLALLALLLAGLVGAAVWLTVAGPTAAGHGALGRALRFPYEQQHALRVVLASATVLLAALNATLMRVAVLSDFEISRGLYRRLRQIHRVNGYATALIAVAVQGFVLLALVDGRLQRDWALFCIGSGLALVVTAGSKVAIVRYIAAQRRHLPALGVTLLLLSVAILFGVLAA